MGNRMKLTSAVVLAGGAGVRLLPATKSIPKAMVRVGGKPMLEWVVRWLKGHEVKNIVVGVAYKKEAITSYFRDGSALGVDMQYSEHTVEGGTAEGFRLAITRFTSEQDFLALNSDQITDLDPQKLARFHLRTAPVATIAVGHARIPFGQVVLSRGRNITEFVEKPLAPFFCSIGIYAFNRGILEFLPKKGDIERTAFPKLARAGRVKAYVHRGSFITVNTQKDLITAEEEMKRHND